MVRFACFRKIFFEFVLFPSKIIQQLIGQLSRSVLNAPKRFQHSIKGLGLAPNLQVYIRFAINYTNSIQRTIYIYIQLSKNTRKIHPIINNILYYVEQVFPNIYMTVEHHNYTYKLDSITQQNRNHESKACYKLNEVNNGMQILQVYRKNFIRNVSKQLLKHIPKSW